MDDRSVRATGAKWVPSDPYTVKLEAARIAGHQVMVFALLRDRHYVENAQIWAEDIEIKCSNKACDRLGLSENQFTIDLRLIGKNATMGEYESRKDIAPEVGVMGFVTAQSPEFAIEIGKLLNPFLLHHPLTREEEQPTFAFQFSPAEVQVGPVFEFCLNHVMQLDDPMEAFSLGILELGDG